MEVKLSEPSIKALCELITSKPYRTGPDLIRFFNQFGWSDEYGGWFPSRWKYAEEKIVALNNSVRIRECIEKAVDPRNFLSTNENIDQVIQDMNDYFQYDGFQLYKSGLVYKVKQIVGSTFGEDIKNIIFASNGPKPDIVLVDALSNKISIVRNAEFCLVYDREVSEDGLFWHELVDWWSEKIGKPISLEVERDLYARLFTAVPATSPPAQLLFKTYFKFREKLSENFPVLLPEVYLHFDPKTLQERGGFEVLKQQRIDFLLLLPNGVRIVIEVDGKQHYATGDKADPQIYGNLMYSNRELQMRGYEVYRFGGYELSGTDATKLVEEFFIKLFKKHKKDLSVP